MEMRSKEARRFPRIDFSGPLQYHLRGSQEVLNTVTENLSLSGICFSHRTFLQPRTPVMMELSLFSQIVRPIARIVWSSPYPHQDKFRLGAEFLEWDPKDKKFLSDFITFKTNQR